MVMLATRLWSSAIGLRLVEHCWDIVQDDWVLGNYKETQIGHMLPGQRAVINVDAVPDHTFYGWVDSFSPGSGTTFALLPLITRPAISRKSFSGSRLKSSSIRRAHEVMKADWCRACRLKSRSI